MTSLTSSQFAVTSEARRLRIRLLAVIEASTVTGPAKNLLEFCQLARDFEAGPVIETALLTFERNANGAPVESGRESEFIQQAMREGVEVHRVSERYAFDRRVFGQLRQTVNRLAPDIIQTHGIKSHFLVRACGAHKGRSWVAFHHGYTSTSFQYAMLAHLNRWSLRAPSQIVAVSQAFSRQLVARGAPRDRIMVLHNAADPDSVQYKMDAEDFEPRDEALNPSPGEKLVLAVGRLSKEKAFTDLVGAIGRLRQMQPELAVRLVILGEGPERQSIEEAIGRAGLQSQILLAGHVRDVWPYYRAADALVISSLSEGSPNVLLEAMAAGIPVVATAVGGIPEIVVDQETASLVPARDPSALALALRRVLQDDSLAGNMAARARELIRTRYSPRLRAKSLVDLYQRLYLKTNAAKGFNTSETGSRPSADHSVYFL
jgi:glycosyltransferase involved in cell wall biosynthesis